MQTVLIESMVYYLFGPDSLFCTSIIRSNLSFLDIFMLRNRNCFESECLIEALNLYITFEMYISNWLGVADVFYASLLNKSLTVRIVMVYKLTTFC